jgi:hypothetical protein
MSRVVRISSLLVRSCRSNSSRRIAIRINKYTRTSRCAYEHYSHTHILPPPRPPPIPAPELEAAELVFCRNASLTFYLSCVWLRVHVGQRIRTTSQRSLMPSRISSYESRSMRPDWCKQTRRKATHHRTAPHSLRTRHSILLFHRSSSRCILVSCSVVCMSRPVTPTYRLRFSSSSPVF